MGTHIQQRGAHIEEPLANSEISTILQRVYANRGVTDPQQLCMTLKNLLPPCTLMQLDAALTLLLEAIEHRHPIVIVGDYDADGATSCALAMRALRHFKADVSYIVPNRFEYGYGLTPEIVDLCVQRSAWLIITVDNGISSVEGAQYARACGIKLLVTDHHLPGQQLPNAEAIINPNQKGDKFPSKHLAGVGVIFYLLIALRTRMRNMNWFDKHAIEEPNIAQWLDIVAVGTVADLVKLDTNNRILVEHGLRRIRSGKGNIGIQALLAIAGVELSRTLASDLGFQVAPRINAAGRLDDISTGIECLLTDNIQQAKQFAETLHELNNSRREIEAQMKDQAIKSLVQLEAKRIVNLREIGICIFEADWHQGVIGIVAARIKEKYYRPTIAFAQAHEGQLKGSARSIPGVHIRDVLECVASRYPSLIDKFGGHAMAAGLTIQYDHYEAFQQAFNQVLSEWVSAEDLSAVMLSDGELQANELTIDIARALRAAGPWGQGFPTPVFDGRFKLKSYHVVGHKHMKITLQIIDSDIIVDGILFNYENYDWQSRANLIHIAYELDVNYYRGLESLQLMVRHFEVVSMH